MAARRPPPKSRLCSHDWHKRVSVAESPRPCLSYLESSTEEKKTKAIGATHRASAIRTLIGHFARMGCVRSAIQGKPKISQRINHKIVVSDLIINIRFCELFRRLALIPRLYRFFSILGDCQIQPVHASSGRCQSVMERIVQDCALTCPCRLRHRGCLYCCPLTETN